MTKTKNSPEDSRDLRRQAEARFAARDGLASDRANMAPETQRVVHELQVHQIELELQNEELQRARTEVEEGLARYADLYEFAPVGYLTLDRSGNVRQLNLTGARLLGQERSRLLGARFGLWVAAESRAAFNGFLAQVFASQTKQVCDVALHPEGADSLTVELTATASQDGQECRVVATDISARRQAEREREELRSQLAQAQKMEAIGTLAGGIAHDFNNILHGLLGGLSILELNQTDERRAEIDEMKVLVERGADLARQLLGFARRGKYDVEPLHLGLVLAKTSEMFGRTRNDISIELDVAPGLMRVLMDHTQLEQMLLNLFVHGGQSMLEGGQLRLRAENAEPSKKILASHGIEPGQFVKLTVSDTGIGMDAATQARVFEPFFTTSGRERAAGLGLASVYGIVKSHGGLITVESQPEIGTTFTLFLPATNRTPSQQKLAAPHPEHGTGTILVVDDEEMLVKLWSRLLVTLGYEVLTASGGREAIALVHKHKDAISLVILDMIMPDMSGREVYAVLRQIAPGLKVLLASGFSLEGQIQDLLALGCSGFIQKPFDLAVMSAKVRSILSPPEHAQK